MKELDSLAKKAICSYVKLKYNINRGCLYYLDALFKNYK